MRQENSVSRRAFLRRVGLAGVAGLGAGSLLAGCGGGEPGETAQTEQRCDDVSGLTQEEIQTRETLEYVDDSPYEDRVCDNCQFWVEPAAGQFCGGCQIVKGPIHPKGYCISWAAQQT